ncbi:hypothetical protein GCM10027276_11410 [Comamonas piscis]
MSILDFFFPKKKNHEAAVCETTEPIKILENQPLVKSKEDKNSAEREKALTDIWTKAGGESEMMSMNTKLWHGGTVSNSSDLDDSRALWCTNDPNKANHYDGTAREHGIFAKLPPFRLILVTTRELKLANFGSASLMQFTVQHCNSRHDEMKAALRAWCLAKSFDGIIDINCGQDEVVVSLPGSNLKIVKAIPL